MSNITRADITEAVYRKLGFSHTESARFVDQVLEEIIEALKRGEIVKISNFATFRAYAKRARAGRNPKTGDAYPISSRTVIGFKAANAFKKGTK